MVLEIFLFTFIFILFFSKNIKWKPIPNISIYTYFSKSQFIKIPEPSNVGLYRPKAGA